MLKVCQNCGADYNVSPSDWKRGKYRVCSTKCKQPKPPVLAAVEAEFRLYADMAEEFKQIDTRINEFSDLVLSTRELIQNSCYTTL